MKEGIGAVPVYQAFLDHAWDVNSFSSSPVLHMAIVNEELTRFLLDKGADPNLIGSRGLKPIECAASMSTPSVVSLLLERGASLEHSNSLHHAACSRRSDEDCFEMMSFLLSIGFHINTRSWKIKQKVPTRTKAGTALMSAVKKQETTMVPLDMVPRVKWLLKRGADRDIMDENGFKPIHYAKDQRLIDLLND